MTKLLEVLDLRGCIVTPDALNCQTQNAQLIVDKGGDYVFALKDNHSKLLEQVKATFEHEGKNDFKHVVHGRNTQRPCPNCGQLISSNANFCGNCGYKLN